MWDKLNKPVDNATLVLFRIFFGLVFLCESVGSFITGWITDNFASVQTNFTFMGFEWLEFLADSNYAYIVFGLMAICSFNIIMGYKYRISMISLCILWGMIYFGQKTSYNNHYYLMWLFTFIMCFLPANAHTSIDAKLNPKIKAFTCPQWMLTIFIVMMSFVYGYATIAKFYSDWLDGTVTKNMFQSINFPEFSHFIFKHEYFAYFIAYMGICFDGLIIPALLYKRTRKWAIIASLIFHIFNSITLQIGVFPYFSLAMSIFFFPPEQIRSFFFRKLKIEDISIEQINHKVYKKMLYYVFTPFIILQFLLPLRHWAIKGNVLETEEGHRLAWRMMLRSRSGEAQFKIIDKESGNTSFFDNGKLLNQKQRNRLNSPDVIWQMAQKIKDYYTKEGKQVEIYCVNSGVAVNNTFYTQTINPKVDLAEAKWHWYKHEDWIEIVKQ
ncbi:HTTM domain-containing protein [Capnocytophaga sp. ARDL2]|uniref:HTTM domain-containing protein n=1 Tax=Capnocytophaga sp. ARDL2 TaxID=3238809 RepID=UPI003558B432